MHYICNTRNKNNVLIITNLLFLTHKIKFMTYPRNHQDPTGEGLYTVTYDYQGVTKYRSHNNKQEPFTYEEARKLYLKMLDYQARAPKLYSNVKCNFSL